LIDEIGWVSVVGMNTSHLGRSKVDLIGLFGKKEGVGGNLVSKVELGMAAKDDFAGIRAQPIQFTDDGGTDHPAVTGDVDLFNDFTRKSPITLFING
jgi:hypothetical protein